jgi:Fe-S-cluster containining protein
LLEEEVRRISKLTKLHPMEFASPISGFGNYKHKMKKRNGICVFLANRACRIYEVRPAVCQLYPFTARKSNGTLIFEVSEDCPGIGLGNQILEEDFKKMSEFAKSRFQ